MYEFCNTILQRINVHTCTTYLQTKFPKANQSSALSKACCKVASCFVLVGSSPRILDSIEKIVNKKSIESPYELRL